MDEMMNSVSVQIQRAINDAISNQVLPQIQNVSLAGLGGVTRKGWDVSAERPEINPEVQRNLNARNNLRNEQDEGHQNGDLPSHNVHDRYPKEYDTMSVFVTLSSTVHRQVQKLTKFWQFFFQSFVSPQIISAAPIGFLFLKALYLNFQIRTS